MVSSGIIIRGEHVTAPPVLVAEVDLVAGVNTLGGVTQSAWTDILTNDVSNPFIHIPGVGLQVTRPIGDSTLVRQGQVLPTAGLNALLLQSGGFSVVIGYVFDNLVTNLPCFPVPRVGVTYNDPDYVHVIRGGDAGLWDGRSPDHQTQSVFSQDFNYDTEDTGTYEQLIGEVPRYSNEGSVVCSIGDQVHTYFLDDFAATATPEYSAIFPSAEPTAAIAIYGSAGVHGTAGNAGASSRCTINRLRFFTPATPVGWYPAHTGLWPIDERA